jgi:hypothetical protein
MLDREGVLELEKELSRRAFFGKVFHTVGAAAMISTAIPAASAAIKTKRPDSVTGLAVYGAIGNLVVPVDQDPGWATFDPGISDYGMNFFVKTVFLANNQIAFDAYVDTLNLLNNAPVILGYQTKFLTMGVDQANKYITDILSGNFDYDGYQAVLSLAVNASVVSAKTLFFSNYPRHLATPGAEFQVLAPSPVATGWDMMGLKGPVGADEEAKLRSRYYDAVEVPGVDFRNPWI